MARAPYDKPSDIEPIDGEVTVVGPGPVGVSITPDATRETARRLGEAADRADRGHVERIDPDDARAVSVWAERLQATPDAVRNATIAVGGDSEAVAMRLASARGARPTRMTAPLRTPDARYLVVRGRLWRTSNPALPEDLRQALVERLMDARRTVRAALRSHDAVALSAARAQVQGAKEGLGERGPIWWTDGAPDFNRRLAKNTPYADWFAGVDPS